MLGSIMQLVLEAELRRGGRLLVQVHMCGGARCRSRRSSREYQVTAAQLLFLHI